ncbi:MAG: hypothetical protein Q4A16_10005 [Lautropia sp.]|nr:hypothetical protein [Lautropia sp.]
MNLLDYLEVLGLGLVFMHFVASAVAVVTILQTDVLLLKRYTVPLTRSDCRRIHKAKPVVTAALWVLWITGILICLRGYLNDPAYLLNQKLMMKVLVVEILTLNGIFLHSVAFKYVKPGRVLARESTMSQRLLVLMGSLSSTSWLFACFLGIARPLNHQMNFYLLLGFYLALLAGAIFFGWLLTHVLARREAEDGDSGRFFGA